MGIEKLSTTWQRFIAFCVLLCILVLLVLVIITPAINQVMRYKNAAADVSFRIERLSRQVARKDALAADVTQLDALLHNQGWFFYAASPPLAAAKLQDTVSGIMRSHGVQPSSTQVVEPRTQGGYTVLALQLRFNTDSTALAAILRDLEASIPLIFIEEIMIRTLSVPQQGGGDRISIQLHLTALMP